MTRKTRAEVTYEASPEQVHAALTDGDQLRAQATRWSYDLDVVEAGPRRVERSRVLDAKVPGFMRRAVPDRVRLRQTDTWDGPTAASWEVVAEGLPGRARGTTRLEEIPGGTRQVVEGTVDVSVPLVGGRIEEWLAERLSRAVEAEAVVVREWLTRDAPEA